MNKGDYGPVRVTGGLHKGKVGYYDDDESERMAIVYFEEPLVGPYYVIRRALLEPFDGQTVPLEKFEKESQSIVDTLGIVVRRENSKSEKDILLAQTKFGFVWGPAVVERTADDPRWGVVISVMGEKQIAEIRVTPGGSVRVNIRKIVKGKEPWKPSGSSR